MFGPATAATSAPDPPRAVGWSRTLWISSALLGAVRAVITLADRERLVAELRRQAPALDQQQVDGAVSTSIAIGLVISLLVLGCYLVVAGRMALGRGWARMTLAVVGGLGVALGILGMIGLASGVAPAFGLRIGPLDVLLSGVGLVLDGAALTLMFVPTANAWFRARRGIRPSVRVAGG